MLKEDHHGIQAQPRPSKDPGPSEDGPVLRGYIGAKIIGEPGANGLLLDLHGLTLNVTKFIDSQKHEQKYGIEHIAIDTDDMPTLVANLKASGAKILEETTVGNGRKVCFFEGPNGVHLEFLESVD